MTRLDIYDVPSEHLRTEIITDVPHSHGSRAIAPTIDDQERRHHHHPSSIYSYFTIDGNTTFSTTRSAETSQRHLDFAIKFLRRTSSFGYRSTTGSPLRASTTSSCTSRFAGTSSTSHFDDGFASVLDSYIAGSRCLNIWELKTSHIADYIKERWCCCCNNCNSNSNTSITDFYISPATTAAAAAAAAAVPLTAATTPTTSGETRSGQKGLYPSPVHPGSPSTSKTTTSTITSSSSSSSFLLHFLLLFTLQITQLNTHTDIMDWMHILEDNDNNTNNIEWRELRHQSFHENITHNLEDFLHFLSSIGKILHIDLLIKSALPQSL